MSETDLVLEIDHPHFNIRVTNDQLKIDVKGTVKNEIEEALENAPGLRETFGRILGIFVPLHIRLFEIDSVKMEKTGEVKIVLHHRSDANIPLGTEEAEKLVNKLNQLIPEAKQREMERIMMEKRAREIVEEDEDARIESAQFPLSPEAMHEEDKVIDKSIEEEENPD
jgi:hypothetical protein